MLTRHISGLPVVDEKRKLVGVVSEADFLRHPETGTEKQAFTMDRRLLWP